MQAINVIQSSRVPLERQRIRFISHSARRRKSGGGVRRRAGFVIAAALTQTSNCGILSLRLPPYMWLCRREIESCTGRFICICEGCRRCKSKKQQRANINRLPLRRRSGAHQECPESMQRHFIYAAANRFLCFQYQSWASATFGHGILQRGDFFEAPPRLFLIKLCDAKARRVAPFFSSRSGTA